MRFDVLETAVDRIEGEATQIFTLLANGQTDRASQHMSTMDRYFAETAPEITELITQVGSIQQRHFATETARAEDLGWFETAAAICIVLIVIGVTCYGHAIAKQMTAAESEMQRFRAALDASPDAVFLIDRQTWGLVDLNDTACSSIGYSREELLSMEPQDIKPYVSDKQLAAKCDEIIRDDRQAGVIETDHRRKDGSTFPVEVVLQLMNGAHETLLIASVRDTTEREQAAAKLESLNRQLVDTARSAGMADIATGVLHNVGDVLNSVNVSANLLTDRLITGRIDNLQKAVAMLEEHSDDPGDFLTSDEKGIRLPAYLRRLSDSLSDDRDFMQTEVGELSMKIDHIKEIVQVQQTHSRRGFVERIVLQELVETALTVNDSSFRRHRIEIQRKFNDVPAIETDKHQVLQILVNLISNAKNAIAQHDGDDRRLTIRIKRSEDSQASIEVQDTGVGIAPDNLDRIFGHGFTTRKDGHGFGLHSSSNAAAELGGTLTVSSESPGHGAKFTLQLPIGKETSCLV